LHISLVEHIFTLRKSFFDSIQGKTEYCNLIISKLLLIVYKVKNNCFIFNEIWKMFCLAICVFRCFFISYKSAISFK